MILVMSPTIGTILPLLFAHQSDWLAMVLVCIPLGAFAGILAVANRRADRDGTVDMRPPERPVRPSDVVAAEVVAGQSTRRTDAPTADNLPTKSS